MKVRVFLEEENRRHTGYMLPVDCWDLPAGAPSLYKGDTLSLMVYAFGEPGTWLEPRLFEVVGRNIWMHYDKTSKNLDRMDVHLSLLDLGPIMRGEGGLGALGTDDPAYPFPLR